MPKKPVEIDLPALASTDVQKRSHGDFYKPVANKDADVKIENLITKKLNELGENVKEVEK